VVDRLRVDLHHSIARRLVDKVVGEDMLAVQVKKGLAVAHNKVGEDTPDMAVEAAAVDTQRDILRFVVVAAYEFGHQDIQPKT
jgi:hypothetical protein